MNEKTKDIASVADDTKAIEAVKSGLKTTEKGNIRQTIENAIYVINNDPMLKDSIKRNELSCKTDIVKEMNLRRRSKTFTDTDFNNIMLRMEKKYGITRDKNIKRAIDIVGNNNHYHPIVDKLESLEWDGKERLRRLFPRYLGIPESDYTYEATRLMMMGAVHRVFYPGIKFEYMICLVGGQGVGKSSFFSLLAMENEWFSDDIRKLDDENVYRKMQGHWIIEMAEMLATCNARSVEEIKSFLSRQSETYKVPYETHPEDRPRQCIFVGTSNNADFLTFDRSGNRRFIPLFADRSKAEHHPMDDEEETLAYIEQCWAEIMDKFHRGVETSLVFDKRLMDELIRMQKMCMPEDTKVGMIARFLDETKEEYVCSTMIFQKAFNREDEAPKNYESREIGSIMRNEFSDEWESVSTHRFEEYGPQRAWRRKNYQEADEDKDGFMQLSDDVELPFNL
ncbi:VapE domain-containing protein [Eubacterium sp.]|uniref:VapE domain-containing protein n=1 Tax=Eubacterium sp. TaxID=142586 RepID=UPI00351FE66E